ncbi:MAG: crotonase/enoyl-CoA hydratase family protein [Candidatus Nanopelagicales bacterium]
MALDLPSSLALDVRGAVAVLTIDRARKRNALDTETVLGLERFFTAVPEGVRAVVLHGDGDHFSAGLDLSDLSDAGVEAGLHHSRMWHRVMGTIQLGTVPVVSVLKGAVIGGGLELASATHIRVAEPSAFYALPEGQRGLFLGGGGSVRLPRLIGVARMTDMMLTGRVYDAAEGHAAGLSHYLVGEGEAFDKALELAGTAAEVAPMTTYAVLQALPRISEVGPHEGYLLESLMAAVASSSEDAQARMRAFLDGRAARVAKPEAQP